MKEAFEKNTVTSREFPVILFDAGGTLFHANPSYEKVYKEVLEKHEQKKSDTEIDAAFISIIRKFNERAENETEFQLTPSLWAEAFVSELQLSSDILHELREAVTANIKMVISQTTVDLLTVLKERGYRLGIVSNWNGILADVLRDNDLLDLFDSVVTSTEAGFSKPHAKIFEASLQDLEVQSHQAIFIGESYAADMVGARKLKMKKILYDPKFRELRALSWEDTSGKVVSIETLKHNRRLTDITLIARFEQILEIFR